jgi:hypothetical protein
MVKHFKIGNVILLQLTDKRAKEVILVTNDLASLSEEALDRLFIFLMDGIQEW